MTKKITKEDLKKAIEEAYALGYRHGSQGKMVVHNLSGNIQSHLEIAALNKNISENSKKINKEILDKHREIVNRHMKEWAKDSMLALNEIIKDVHKHHGKKE